MGNSKVVNSCTEAAKAARAERGGKVSRSFKLRAGLLIISKQSRRQGCIVKVLNNYKVLISVEGREFVTDRKYLYSVYEIDWARHKRMGIEP